MTRVNLQGNPFNNLQPVFKCHWPEVEEMSLVSVCTLYQP